MYTARKNGNRSDVDVSERHWPRDSMQWSVLNQLLKWSQIRRYIIVACSAQLKGSTFDKAVTNRGVLGGQN